MDVEDIARLCASLSLTDVAGLIVQIEGESHREDRDNSSVKIDDKVSGNVHRPGFSRSNIIAVRNQIFAVGLRIDGSDLKEVENSLGYAMVENLQLGAGNPGKGIVIFSVRRVQEEDKRDGISGPDGEISRCEVVEMVGVENNFVGLVENSNSLTGCCNGPLAGNEMSGRIWNAQQRAKIKSRVDSVYPKVRPHSISSPSGPGFIVRGGIGKMKESSILWEDIVGGKKRGLF
ncbi:hypothetical protein ACOSP7_022445 [Xanthoceras sorbifolium]